MSARNRILKDCARGAVKPLLVIELAILMVLVAALIFIMTNISIPKGLPDRPTDGRLLVDKAGLFSYVNESTESFLELLRDRYQIETVILTLPSLKNLGTVEEAAAKLMTAWKIGERYGNRGLLLLYAAAEKEVKLEISYELEDVFTDLFTGQAEDLQLKPYLRQGDANTGLSAVMEELEKRAVLKKEG